MITVLGASGFIGSAIVNRLQQTNEEYFAPSRDAGLCDRNLGDIIYCIGLTADFRIKPFETISAHICKLNEVLSKSFFNSLTYLSSTRVYINGDAGFARESDKITVDPTCADDLYNLSKLTGERLCLSSNKKARVVRLSNVVGMSDRSSNFFSEILTKIRQKEEVRFYQTLNSCKDYIFLNDVVDLLIKISKDGKSSVYNVASGKNTSVQEVISGLQQYFDFEYIIDPNAAEVLFTGISIEKIKAEFNYKPTEFSKVLPLII